MSTLEVSPADTQPEQPTHSVTNDFSIQVATVNGSGSQTANSVLMRAIFQMGIPVSGKNMFPSNIAGLPTWFTIRVSKHGYIGRRKEIDFLVAMNPETAREDVMKLDSGAAVVYDEPLKLNELRTDVHFFPVPFDKLVAPVCPDAKLRKLVRNMIYDGVVAKLLSIEMAEIRQALVKQFGKKKAKAAELNWGACQAGFEYATNTFTEPLRFQVERMNETAGKIIIDGNAACALGAMFAGCTVVTWYPITPSSSLVETMIGYMKRFRIDPETGKATFAIVQAEDELASIGMALGAGWAGARSMTATAGPGISLMSEFIGLGYYAELPAVVFNVERVGPSTGLPTLPAQADMMQVRWGSHGDYEVIALCPNSPQECFDLTVTAFNYAEQYRCPVFVMMDEVVGHMTEKVVIPPPEQIEVTPRRYTTLPPDEFLAFQPREDLVPDMPRTGEGYNVHVTGLTHDERGYPDMTPGTQDKLVRRLQDKIKKNVDKITLYEEEQIQGAEVVVVSYGITSRVAQRAIELARKKGVKVGKFRLITAWPFPEKQIAEIAGKVKAIVVVELNLGQMVREVERAAAGKAIVRFVGHAGGSVHRPEDILQAIMEVAR